MSALVVVLVMITAGCVGTDSEGLKGATSSNGPVGEDSFDAPRPEAPQEVTLVPPEDAVPAWREVTLTVRVTGPEALARVAIVDAERPASPCTRVDARVPGDVTLSCIFTASGERPLVARLTVLEDDAFAESAPVTVIVGEGHAPGRDVTPVTLLESGGFEVNVPVDVVLVGFEAGVADALQEKLGEKRLAHTVHLGSGAKHGFPPSEDGARDALEGWRAPDVPLVTTAVPRVTEAPADIAAGILGFAATAQAVAGDGTLLDGNAMEAFLAEQLPRMRVPVDPNRPALVILHGGSTLPVGHAWQYTLPGDTLAPVRVFGEKLPLLVMDASAAADPWVEAMHTDLQGEVHAPAYASPLEPGGAATVNALAAAVDDAIVLRLLEGPLYAPATTPCHGVTTVLATRATGLGALPSEDAVDQVALERAFRDLFGTDRVFVDVKTVSLPQDDPVLDALTRGIVPASFGGMDVKDAIRYWLEQNWADYWVAHEGCEAYVSLLVQGDASDEKSTGGQALYDPEKGARVSISIIGGVHQLTTDEDQKQVMTYIVSHETGHLTSLRHPHDEQTKDVDAGTFAWSSTWNAMSYQTNGIADFGAVNAANLARNRAAYLVQHAMANGLTPEDPALATAIDHLSRFEWRAAAEALEPALAAE